MQLDIYRRGEPHHKLSYIAVPAGKPIPEEATSAEWLAHARSIDLNEYVDEFLEFGIEHPADQLREKGYAITSLSHQLEAND